MTRILLKPEIEVNACYCSQWRKIIPVLSEREIKMAFLAALFLVVSQIWAHTPHNSIHPLVDGAGQNSLNLMDVGSRQCALKVPPAALF